MKRSHSDGDSGASPSEVRRVMDLADVSEEEARELLSMDTGPFGSEGPTPPLPDSPIGWVLSPWEHLFAAVQFLQREGHGWRRVEALAEELLGMGYAEDASRYAALAHRLRQAETLLGAHGLRFNATSRRVEALPEGRGRPRSLLRELVAALVAPPPRIPPPLGAPVTEASAEVRSRLASILEPYLGPELTATSRGSPLYVALEEVLRV